VPSNQVSVALLPPSNSNLDNLNNKIHQILSLTVRVKACCCESRKLAISFRSGGYGRKNIHPLSEVVLGCEVRYKS